MYSREFVDIIRKAFIDEEVEKVYNLVLKNQLQTIGEMKEGAICKNVAKMVVNDFEITEQPEEKKETNPFEEFGNSITTESQIGEQIQIDDEELPF